MKGNDFAWLGSAFYVRYIFHDRLHLARLLITLYPPTTLSVTARVLTLATGRRVLTPSLALQVASDCCSCRLGSASSFSIEAIHFDLGLTCTLDSFPARSYLHRSLHQLHRALCLPCSTGDERERDGPDPLRRDRLVVHQVSALSFLLLPSLTIS